MAYYDAAIMPVGRWFHFAMHDTGALWIDGVEQQGVADLLPSASLATNVETGYQNKTDLLRFNLGKTITSGFSTEIVEAEAGDWRIVTPPNTSSLTAALDTYLGAEAVDLRPEPNDKEAWVERRRIGPKSYVSKVDAPASYDRVQLWTRGGDNLLTLSPSTANGVAEYTLARPVHQDEIQCLIASQYPPYASYNASDAQSAKLVQPSGVDYSKEYNAFTIRRSGATYVDDAKVVRCWKGGRDVVRRVQNTDGAPSCSGSASSCMKTSHWTPQPSTSRCQPVL